MDRKYLRKKIQDLLKAANIKGIDQDVFSQRSVPTDINYLPVALVYTKSLSVTRLDESPKRYLKDLDVTIEVITTNNDDESTGDELDCLSLAVEKAIEDDVELSSCVEYANLKTIVQDFEGGGQSPLASSIITYTIGYVTEPRTDFIFPDLKTVRTQYDINGNTDGETVDLIENLDQ